MDESGGALRTERRAPEARCWSCGHGIAPDDRYCAYCSQGQGAFLRWYYRPIWIALLAVTALGPFVLPLIWRTPLLGRAAKWIGTLLVIGVTAWVCWRLAITVSQLEQLLEA